MRDFVCNDRDLVSQVSTDYDIHISYSTSQAAIHRYGVTVDCSLSS